MIESAQKQAAELREQFDHLRFCKTFPVHLGDSVLYRWSETDKYEMCPCNSGDKYKWCCFERTKAFRIFLNNNKNDLFFQ